MSGYLKAASQSPISSFASPPHHPSKMGSRGMTHCPQQVQMSGQVFLAVLCFPGSLESPSSSGDGAEAEVSSQTQEKT